MTKLIGLYPGTFDPVTLGHVDIVERAVKLVDELVIGVAINRDKSPLFSLAVSDFEYEFQMVGMNQALNDEIETVFLMADVRYQSIASRLVKEIARLGGDVSSFVPKDVSDKLIAKFAQK